jgi:cellulose biosynthesis protein BcsQ
MPIFAYYKPKKKTMSIKIGFVNQKGGVGKTTLGMSTCTALSSEPYNRKCAFIECDAQESAVMQRKKDILKISEELSYLRVKQNHPGIPKEEIEEKAEMYYRAIREEITSDPNRFFKYPVYYCETSELMDTLVTIEDDYEFIFVDMPGQAQGDGLSTLLISLDHAFMPIQSGDFDLSSSIAFLEQKLLKFKAFKESRGNNEFFLNVNIVFNKVTDTLRYRDLILSFKEMFGNDERVSLMDEKKCLPDSVFYEDNTNTYQSIFEARTKSANEKAKQAQFKVFIEEFLKIVENDK